MSRSIWICGSSGWCTLTITSAGREVSIENHGINDRLTDLISSLNQLLDGNESVSCRRTPGRSCRTFPASCLVRLAVAVGFEPTEACTSHAFEACSFGRSDTPPPERLQAPPTPEERA